MLLTYRNGHFLFGSSSEIGKARRLAQEAGLALSRPASANRGYPVYITTEPYAVLHLWEYADNDATALLANLRMAWESSGRNSVDDESRLAIPAPPGRVPLPYQAAGVQYAKDRPHVLFGDEPGLGKTIEAILLANLNNAKRVLVICPAAIRLNWQREVRNWSTIPDVTTYPVLKASDGIHPYANYVMVSYEIARDSLWAVLREYEWDMLVIDEAHYLKSPDAARTQAIFGGGHGKFKDGGIAEKARQIVALTGTPLPNRPRECYTLARALAWDSIDWMSYATFKERFNPGGRDFETGRGWEYTGRLPELNARLRCNFMVRRAKADVLKDLPPKRYELAYVETTGAISLAVAAEKMLDIDPDTLLASGPKSIDGAISTVRRLMGEAMAPQAAIHCDLLLDGGVEKLVVFAWHRNVMDTLEKALAQYGVVRIDGSTSPRTRHEAIERFRHEPKTRVFLGQMQAAGTGIDGLQDVASHAVFAEASWVPGENEQCVDRLHRIGQAGSVLAQFLVAAGSLSERILGRAIEKAQITHKALDAAPETV